MFKKSLSLLLAATMVLSIAGCGSTSAAATEDTAASTAAAIGTVANTLAEDEDTLVSTYADQFEQLTYTDSETGLSITYNLYLPEGYDENSSYPMVVFIADSSCAGGNATSSLTQGRGALVWATEEWQSVNPTIVAVPTYPETILDDHGYFFASFLQMGIVSQANVQGMVAHPCDYYEITADLDV